MQLTPRYDGQPVLRTTARWSDIATALVRQRSRLARELARLDPSDWAAPSRCVGWSAQDVVTHLISTNDFWTWSITSCLNGRPSRLLATFDPVAQPAQLVAARGPQDPAVTLAEYERSTAALADAVDQVTDAPQGWARLGEAPIGHVELTVVALHALWDAWIHERDILLPLEHPQNLEPDEVRAALAYACALGPTFLALRGSTRRARLQVRTQHPEALVVVEIDRCVTVSVHSDLDPASITSTLPQDVEAGHHGIPDDYETITISAPAIDLTDAFSLRAPMPSSIAGQDLWMLDGIRGAFEKAI